jgi:hypothetical protein
VTDDGYLTTYSFPDPDLLESNIRIGRTERDMFFDAGISNFVSLRDGDDNETLPTRVAEGRFVQRFEPGAIGGVAELRFDALGYVRPRTTPGTPRTARRWPPTPRGFRRCWTGGGPKSLRAGSGDLRDRAGRRSAPPGRTPTARSTTPRRG